MDFNAFIESAWNDHAESPQAVADRLLATVHDAQARERVAPLARLVTHVFGEHLGQWHRGIDVLESLRSAPASDGNAGVERTLAQCVATLGYAGGDPAAVDALALEDRIAALAGAGAALSGRAQFKAALVAFDAAMTAAQAGLPPGSPAIRALAVGGNNLAAALEEKSDRDPTEKRGMVAAARAGLQYWKLAGTWLEEQRAEYRLARSLLQGRVKRVRRWRPHALVSMSAGRMRRRRSSCSSRTQCWRWRIGPRRMPTRFARRVPRHWNVGVRCRRKSSSGARPI